MTTRDLFEAYALICTIITLILLVVSGILLLLVLFCSEKEDKIKSLKWLIYCVIGMILLGGSCLLMFETGLVNMH